jgi:hypothetical protein
VTPEQIAGWALALHRYVAKGGDAPDWWAGRKFSAADEAQIKREFLRRLASNGMRHLLERPE